MTVPLKLEIEWVFESDSFSDITSDLLRSAPVQVTRGVQGAGRKASPGTMTLTLKNFDGQYTPEFTTGANYPNVRRGRRIKLSAYVNSTWKVRFTGYVNQWGVGNVRKGAGSFCTLTCVDGLGYFAAPLGPTAREVLEQYGCVAYWPCTETDGTVLSEVMGKGYPSLTLEKVGAGGGTLTLGGGDSLPIDKREPGVSFQNASTTNGWRIKASRPLAIPSAFTVGLYVSGTASTGNGIPVVQLIKNSSSIEFYRNNSDTTMHLACTLRDPSTGSVSTSDTTNGAALEEPGFQMFARTGITVRMYLGTSGGGPEASFDAASLYVAGGPQRTAKVADRLTVAHVFILDHAASSAEMGIIATQLGGVLESPVSRVTRWYRWAGEPQTVSVLGGASSVVSLAQLPTDGTTPRDLTQSAAEAVSARFHFSRDGQPCWMAGDYLPTPVTIAPEWIEPGGFEFATTPDDYLWKVDATLTGGGTYTYAKDNPDTRNTDSISGAAADDSVTKSAAQWIANTADGGARAPQVTIHMDRRTPTEQATLADLDIGSRLLLTSLAETLPSGLAVVIGGYTETFSDTWDQTWNLSKDHQLFLIGSSLIDGTDVIAPW